MSCGRLFPGFRGTAFETFHKWVSTMNPFWMSFFPFQLSLWFGKLVPICQTALLREFFNRTLVGCKWLCSRQGFRRFVRGMTWTATRLVQKKKTCPKEQTVLCCTFFFKQPRQSSHGDILGVFVVAVGQTYVHRLIWGWQQLFHVVFFFTTNIVRVELDREAP